MAGCCAFVTQWSQVRGHLPAAKLSMERVGWAWLIADLWQTRNGIHFNPCEVGPWMVQKLLLRDIEPWQVEPSCFEPRAA